MGPNRNPHWTHKRTEGYVIVSTIRRNIFTKDDGSTKCFLYESWWKYRQDRSWPEERSFSSWSFFKMFLTNFLMLGKKDKLLKFFKLVQDGKFPLNNIAFELFLDIVEWFDKGESRQMRYSPSTIQFLWLGRKLFGGRFIRFMSGPKHESDILTGSSTPNRCGNPFERI